MSVSAYSTGRLNGTDYLYLMIPNLLFTCLIYNKLKNNKLINFCLGFILVLCLIGIGCSKKETNGQNGDPNVVVSTIAGGLVKGSLDGVGSGASFNSPVGIACDAFGNIYVADAGNYKIRKIAPGGVVTTFAGSGTPGASNGTGGSASFNALKSLVCDAQGNVYVTDGSQIRKISLAGSVSTLAGLAYTQGATNGAATVATFNNPGNLAIDATGNIYVADYGNNMIRKVTPAGVVSTYGGTGVAGMTDGYATGATFNGPAGLAFDSGGNLYVADRNNCLIRKITAAGAVITISGTTVPGVMNGNGTSASFDHPDGLTIDAAGNLYIADTFNNLVRQMTPAGNVTSYAGTGSTGVSNGPGDVATFSTPRQLAIDAAGTIYVTDLTHQVRKISR